MKIKIKKKNSEKVGKAVCSYFLLLQLWPAVTLYVARLGEAILAWALMETTLSGHAQA